MVLFGNYDYLPDNKGDVLEKPCLVQEEGTVCQDQLMLNTIRRKLQKPFLNLFNI
eukprot:m.691337 g.691337  ORF g.691337 m.691337 type:complete len:55 (-) comp22854_c0_seq7:735-899(-)